VADPSRYNAERLQVYNELHDIQIKDLLVRVVSLETSRTWVIGLSVGLGIGLGLIIWLRRLIVKALVEEAVPPPPKIYPKN
jgi:hypothetical protein